MNLISKSLISLMVSSSPSPLLHGLTTSIKVNRTETKPISNIIKRKLLLSLVVTTNNMVVFLSAALEAVAQPIKTWSIHVEGHWVWLLTNLGTNSTLLMQIMDS